MPILLSRPPASPCHGLVIPLMTVFLHLLERIARVGVDGWDWLGWLVTFDRRVEAMATAECEVEVLC